MKSAILAGVVLLLAGCSGGDDEPPCDLAHRIGTYVVSWKEHANGLCGPITDSVARADPNAPLSASCALDAPDSISTDQCQIERSFTCMQDSGATASFVGFTREHNGGATLTGTIQMSVVRPDGSALCTSTYDVTFTRQ